MLGTSQPLGGGRGFVQARLTADSRKCVPVEPIHEVIDLTISVEYTLAC